MKQIQQLMSVSIVSIVAYLLCSEFTSLLMQKIMRTMHG